MKISKNEITHKEEQYEILRGAKVKQCTREIHMKIPGDTRDKNGTQGENK